jgi:hypothetical protein
MLILYAIPSNWNIMSVCWGFVHRDCDLALFSMIGIFNYLLFRTSWHHSGDVILSVFHILTITEKAHIRYVCTTLEWINNFYNNVTKFLKWAKKIKRNDLKIKFVIIHLAAIYSFNIKKKFKKNILDDYEIMKTWPFKMIQETFFKDVDHVEEITVKTKTRRFVTYVIYSKYFMALRVIWQYTDRSIYCHMTRSDMNYLLYYTFHLK